MPVTDVPELSSPKFAGLRAQLACVFIEHKADLGVPTASDQDIIDHVDDIMVLMWSRTAAAVASGSADWCKRYGWFIDLIGDLVEGRKGRPLDS